MSNQMHDAGKESYNKTVFGFWIYLLTDFVLFATIFAAYFVLRKSLYGGLAAKDLVPLTLSFSQSILLLCSIFSISLGSVFAHRKDVKKTYLFYGLTFILGLSFTILLFLGLTHLVADGNGWQRSAFLSAYFTLLGTFACHMVLALLWILVFMPLVYLRGITYVMLQRLDCLKMFWQFLGVIWVVIFTIVYLIAEN